jgi:hypothetical protein
MATGNGNKFKYFVFVIPIVIGVCVWGSNRPITHGPGEIAPDQPLQRIVSTSLHFERGEFIVWPLAEFHIKARVLSRKNYSFGQEAKLSPVDLALGWGPMSDEKVLSGVSISQSGRWYMWSVKELTVPRAHIERNSANMHMIPSTPQIKKQLKNLKKGSLIECKGYLVEITGPNGWYWKSSLSRNDTGQGACEVVWVEELNVL